MQPPSPAQPPTLPLNDTCETMSAAPAPMPLSSPEDPPCHRFDEAIQRQLDFPLIARALKREFFPDITEEPVSYSAESSSLVPSAMSTSWSSRRNAIMPRRIPLHERAGSSSSSISSTGSSTRSYSSANVSNFFASSTNSSETNITSLRSQSNLATSSNLPSNFLEVHAAKILVTLDGGGIRGVLALVVLKQIDVELRKWGLDIRDCVDLIGGTSTGGIAAVMFALLGLPLDKMVEKYISVANDLFGKTKAPVASFIFTGAKHSSDRQRKIYTKVVEETIGDANAKLRDKRLTKDADIDTIRGTSQRCFIPTFVVSIDSANVRDAVVMSSYEANDSAGDTSSISIVDAAIATSAAPTYFHSLHHAGHEFIDGGVGYNNPTEIAISQMKLLYGEDAYPHTILSFGTGRRRTNPFKAATRKRSRFGIRSGLANMFGMLRTFACMSTDSEMVHKRVKEYFKDRRLDGYYRFNLDSLAEIPLDDHRSVRKAIEMSQAYLEDPDTKAMVDEVVLRILGNASSRAAAGLTRGTVRCADG